MNVQNIRTFSIASAVVFAGSLFLTFVSGTAVFVGSMSFNGFNKLQSTDVALILVTGAVLVLSTLKSWSKTQIGFTVLAALLAAHVYTAISNDVSFVNALAGSLGVASIGVGVYVMIVGAAGSAVGVLLRLCSKDAVTE